MPGIPLYVAYTQYCIKTVYCTIPYNPSSLSTTTYVLHNNNN